MTIEQLCVATTRALVIDTVNKAKSGHPGMPLGSAPFLFTLFTKHLVSDPKNPQWVNRDRFVLSAGHASALLYSTLHLSGYDLKIDDLKSFRQLNSRTPGHPEYGHTPGVDATTGPLGQGIAQAVGMALAERSLSAMFLDLKLIDHFTYVLLGDGCLQEGVTQEAISFAGHQKLNKLIMVYDSNDVTLDGPLSLSFSEDVGKRFKATGWQVLVVDDGNDTLAIDQALRKAKRSKEKPTLIIMKTIIGYGSKNQGTSKVHGAPLGEEDGNLAKASYGYNRPAFDVPNEVYEYFSRTIGKRGAKNLRKWKKSYKISQEIVPNRVRTFSQAFDHNLSPLLDNISISFDPNYSDATRNTSQLILNRLMLNIPFMNGGSADVAKSVMTSINGEKDSSPINHAGRNINFGIREFAAAAIQNGMQLHKGLSTYIGSFLVFSDYMKPALRLAALSKLPSLFVFSHDSVALGEDGPTHQPIEQLAMMRSIPNFNVMRPADANETWDCYKIALTLKSTPSAIVLSRQSLPLLPSSGKGGSFKGAYEVGTSSKVIPDLTLIASGSEVSLALKVKLLLEAKGFGVSVVSMPSFFIFEQQSEEYRSSLFTTPYNRNVSIEALTTFGWSKYAAHNIGIDSFGVSAPGPEAMTFFGFTPEKITERVISTLKL